MLILREWGRIGVTGFGGPPAHLALLRTLMVDRLGVMDAREFVDANAACGLMPGPASTQMAIFCAYRTAGPAGAVVGGIAFVLPAVILVLALSLLFLSRTPPLWIRGAGSGAGAGVPAVAIAAARAMSGPLGDDVGDAPAQAARWGGYAVASAAAAVWLGPYLVLVLLACGAIELCVQHGGVGHLGVALPVAAVPAGGIGALAWTALKVGALSFGGGFVIIPLMQGDAVRAYHWMSSAQFLTAVVLGQVTPGPVVATVAAVGYAAHGIGGGLLGALVAFTPSFAFILVGGRRFGRLRANAHARAFLDGAGPAAIGAILGAAIILAGALAEWWQFVLLAMSGVSLLLLRGGVVVTLVGTGMLGAVAAVAGAGVPH